MNIAILLVLLTSIKQSLGVSSCTKIQRRLVYHKIKSCHKGTTQVIAIKQVDSLEQCERLANEKRGLAFNFRPPKASSNRQVFAANCHVLDCPAEGNNISLVLDKEFDYYSAYGNPNVTLNATCIKSVGIFKLTPDYQTYIESISICQNMSGDLADVTTERRTLMLSRMLKDTMTDWYQAVYVGLDDLDHSGVFKTSFDSLLACSNFRAWAPGHPRRNRDCAILDAEGVWRTVKCDRVKLKGLCELYLEALEKRARDIKNVTCDHISELKIRERKKCLINRKLFEIYQNASRLDQCGLEAL